MSIYLICVVRAEIAFLETEGVIHVSIAQLDDVRIHDLRHTFASLLINKGVSLYEVQQLLGHSSVQMTQRYAHLTANTLADCAEIVADIVS